MKRIILAAVWVLAATASLRAAGELRFALRTEPKTFDPALVEDESSESIRYLTGGVLMRVNRATQELEPELALSWKILENGRAISFRLREGVRFSDGTAFTADDVAYTFKRLMDPALHSATGDAFRSENGKLETLVAGPSKITLRFAAPLAGLDRLFDQVAIVSAQSPLKEKAVLGPFRVKDYRAGAYIQLERNPYYWKKDAAGRPLPYLDSIHLDIEQNREVELLRFQRGEIQLINTLEPDHFDRLAKQGSAAVRDSGPGMDSEFFWFNQVENSPIPWFKKVWFESAAFRRAISESINRDDIARIVYRGHATPASGPVSRANKFWFNATLRPPAYRPEDALRELQQAGFRYSKGVLSDTAGHPVEFTIVTNSGNQARERMAAMMQQDLAKIGVKLTVATLDFPSLLERMNRTFDYEACLLGLVNVDLDPNLQMNIWLSSSSMHSWNPKQTQPITEWETNIDRLMRLQASAQDPKRRKAAFDEVQKIVVEQAPIIYLVNKNALSAVAATVRNAKPVALTPQAFWNADQLSIDSVIQSKR